MKGKHRLTCVMLAALAVLMGALSFFELQDRSLQRLQNKSAIRIGYAVEAPYAFTAAGRVTGLFPEVAKLVVAQLEIPQIEWIQTDFDLLITELEAGRFDMIATGLYITPERATRVAFSTPVLYVQQGLLVPRGNPRQIHSYQQARNTQTLKLAVIAGASEETLLKRIGLLPSQIVVVPDARTGHTAVESGLADGLALSAPTIRWMARHDQLQETEMAQPFLQPEPALVKGLAYCAFAFRKGDRQLLTAWDQAMQPLISSTAHLAVIENFGFTAAERPGIRTTQETLSR